VDASVSEMVMSMSFQAMSRKQQELEAEVKRFYHTQ
jgi:hypothetical protein